MNKVGFKKDLVYKFWLLAGKPELDNQRLILVTPAGVITGMPAELPIDADFKNLANEQTLTKYFSDAIKDFRSKNEIGESEDIPGNDGGLALQDVVITTGSSKLSIPFIVVFYDQIISVSIGNI